MHFGEQPGFAHAGLADQAHDLSLPRHRLLVRLVQHREFAGTSSQRGQGPTVAPATRRALGAQPQHLVGGEGTRRPRLGTRPQQLQLHQVPHQTRYGLTDHNRSGGGLVSQAHGDRHDLSIHIGGCRGVAQVADDRHPGVQPHAQREPSSGGQGWQTVLQLQRRLDSAWGMILQDLGHAKHRYEPLRPDGL